MCSTSWTKQFVLEAPSYIISLILKCKVQLSVNIWHSRTSKTTTSIKNDRSSQFQFPNDLEHLLPWKRLLIRYWLFFNYPITFLVHPSFILWLAQLRLYLLSMVAVVHPRQKFLTRHRYLNSHLLIWLNIFWLLAMSETFYVIYCTN